MSDYLDEEDLAAFEERKRAKELGLTTKELRKLMRVEMEALEKSTTDRLNLSREKLCLHGTGMESKDGCGGELNVNGGCDKCMRSESGWARDCREEASGTPVEVVDGANPGWISQDDSVVERMEQARLERMTRKTSFTPLHVLDLSTFVSVNGE